jgi:hypothetical protein
MGEINTGQLSQLISEIKSGVLKGKFYHEKYPPATTQSGPTCGMYSLKWAMDYRALKTGVKGELVPARARDNCANCGAELRDLTEDIFQKDVRTVRDGSGKKFYYCDTCASLPDGKQVFTKTMRSLAKADGLSVMGELMEPPKLLKLAEMSGFKTHTSLVDVTKAGKGYDQCLIDTLDAGKMALLIYDINPADGGPGSNGGTKAHWCVVFGYYAEKGKMPGAGADHVLAVHGWGQFFDWTMDELMKSVAQMKVHPGWDLRVPAVKTATATQSFGAFDAPSEKPSYKKDGVAVIPPVQKDERQVNVPGTDYANWNKQYIAFG